MVLIDHVPAGIITAVPDVALLRALLIAVVFAAAAPVPVASPDTVTLTLLLGIPPGIPAAVQSIALSDGSTLVHDGCTVKEKAVEALPLELVAVIVAVLAPAAAGVPLMTPPLLSDKPAGSDPLVTAQVIVASPVAVSVWE